MGARTRTVWRCQTCGAGAPRWVGRCSECGEFGTYVEELERPAPDGATVGGRMRAQPVSLSTVGTERALRLSTGVSEFDLVLGGGLVPGSLVLLGGEPGIGKSTLLLQVADAIARSGGKALYVCGEESPGQVGLRAKRLGAVSDEVTLLPEVDITGVETAISEVAPTVVVLDSIQTVFDPDLSGVPGSIGQIRACTERLMRVAKAGDVTVLIVGHVTKDGAIAGPRVLEHMVDTVLYFEGDRDRAFRVVRAAKNRFGSVSEIGVFEMTETGLLGVGSPSAALLSDRSESLSGSVVMPTVEGSRPFLVEIQALVSQSHLPVPRRSATGIEAARLAQVIAVLERRARVSFAGQDVLVSVAGGLRVSEPAVDLPLALALVSALRDIAPPAGLAAFGEIGLTGHVRPVSHTVARIKEAKRFGLRLVAGAAPDAAMADELVATRSIREALSLLD